MKLKDICLDFFTFIEKDDTEVTCYLYQVREIPDLFMIQGETLNELSWIHIQGIEPAMLFWENLKQGGNIMNRIEDYETDE
jgi:hypothetical protein